MSKPIKLTDELIAKIQEEFIESVKKMKMSDGKVSYTKNFKWDGDEKASVVFSPVAFAKMTMLVQNFSSEVAWHGVATRDENVKNKFYISDIMVYPQIVTGSTVNTDQEAYQTWLYTFEDDVFNNIRMQGHSHVDFGTNPSGVDLDHQEKILSQVDDDMFYIFMIWNKKFDRHIKIFDMANNTLFENGDVDVYIGENGCDLGAFIKEAKDIVKTKSYPQHGTQYPAAYKQYGNEVQSKDEPDYKGKKNKPDIGSKRSGYNFNYMYDDDDCYEGHTPYRIYR